jgi:hypothetical protein
VSHDAGSREPPPDCGCSWRWGSYGRLYNVDMGKGWLLVQRSVDCPVEANHGRGWGRPMDVRVAR